MLKTGKPQTGAKDSRFREKAVMELLKTCKEGSFL